jgi:hypothetical protein
VSTTSVETGGKHTIRSPLNPNLFSKIFQKTFLTFYLPSLFDWGGKSNQNFFPSKFISNFFLKSQNRYPVYPPFFIGAAKVHPTLVSIQIFFQKFLSTP